MTTTETGLRGWACKISGFVDFVGAHPHYALTAVFLLALFEAIPVIGTVVPGSTLIVGISVTKSKRSHVISDIVGD